MAEYRILLRDPRSLQLIEELPTWRTAIWTRRHVAAGNFQLFVDAGQVNAASTKKDTIVEVKRDGAHEFAGVICYRHYDSDRRIWSLAGHDLKGWFFGGRQVIPASGQEFDAQTAVVAETAVLHYIDTHLVNPTDTDRAISGELTTTFNVAADQARGSTISHNARYAPLLATVEQVALAGGLIHDMTISVQDTYEYSIALPADRTEATGSVPVIFSVQGFDNVAQSIYIEDCVRLANMLYVLGTGTGSSRTVREVKDASNILDGFRREGSIDARAASTNAELDDAGNVAIAESIADTRTATMEPLTVGPTVYRTDFDVGDDVTVDFRDISEKVDRRIVEVTTRLNRGGERVTVGLGRRPQTIERILAEIVARNRPAQVV